MRAWWLAFLAGILAVPGFAPFYAFPLALLSLAALFWLWQRAPSPRHAAMLGWGWGMGLFLGGVSWLYVALHHYGGMPLPLAVLAIAAFSAYLALYPALAGYLSARLRSGRWGLDAAVPAAAWTLCEWLRGWVFTGFPWLNIGYTQTPPSPLAGFFPVFGVFGVCAILTFMAAALAGARRARWHGGVLVTVAMLALGWGLTRVAWTQPVGTPLQVKLLQTNVDQGEKFDGALLSRWLDLNLQMVLNNPAELVVLPEGTLPLLIDDVPSDYLKYLAEPVRRIGGNLVLGVFLKDEQGGIHNSAISIGADARQHYQKHHLVPFGEYSPPMFGWLFQWLRIPMSDQAPGALPQPPLLLGGHHVAVNICYEDAFGQELIRDLPGAEILLNLSNLAWYGKSFAQPQHLQMSQARALETGRPMLRATNTGMTAVVAPDGHIVAQLAPFTEGVLSETVQGYGGMTPYARWGNLPVVLAALAVLLGAGWLHRRNRYR